MFRNFVVRSFAMLLMCWSVCGRAQQAPGAQTLSNTTPTDAVPRLIKFSGVLKDESWAPRSGVVGVTFALYKEQEGGAALWLETQNVQADTTGHYSVSLGVTQAFGLPTDVFVSGEARWLGVQPEGQAEQPRVLLMSVPYALKAADAETIGGLPPSAFVRANADIGIVSSGSQSSDNTARSTSQQAGLSLATNKTVTTPGGKINTIPLWAGNTVIGNSALFQSSAGKVGLGTTSPGASLEIDSPNQLGLFLHAPFSGVGAGLDFATTGSGGKQWEILATGNGATQGAGKLNIRDVTSGKDVLTIDAGDGVNVNTALNANNLSANATSTTFPAITGTTTSTATLTGGVEGLAVANSGETVGVNGFSNSPAGIGVLGAHTFSLTFDNFFGLVTAGVWGDSSGSGGSVIGVVGTADNAIGVAAHTSGTGSPALYAQNDAAASGSLIFDAIGGIAGGECAIDVFGNLHCTGTVSGAAAVQGGARKVALYAVEAAENWFEDAGSAQLVNGTTTVRLDATFA